MSNYQRHTTYHRFLNQVNPVVLAKRFGTPLYVYSEDEMISRMREYKSAMKTHAGEGQIAYAGKAYLTVRMARLVADEGLWINVASAGELYIAKAAGFPAHKLLLHGNNKTQEELDMAVRLGVGRIVVDNLDEIRMVEDAAKNCDRVQDVLLRVTPGIDPHTHEYLTTGEIDSKFGIPLHKDLGTQAAFQINLCPHLNLKGVHCHIGSQILEIEPFVRAAEVMMEYIAALWRTTGISVEELNLGGGLGVAYTDETEVPVSDYIMAIANTIHAKACKLGVKVPVLFVEPGRSIVGQAGMTLYTVGAVKELPGGESVASVDGGMSDNPRPMLYGAKYRAVVCGKSEETLSKPMRIVGKHCEEGDTLIKGIRLPGLEQGDILALMVTGAYHYTMSSNYNGALRPAVVHLRDQRAHLVVERQSYADLVRGQTAIMAGESHDYTKAAGGQS